MLVEGVEKEAVSLLKDFGLETHLARLEKDRREDSALAQIILDAYVETKEPDFYGLYYMSTYPHYFEWAKSYLKRVSSPLQPEDIVSDAFSIFLKICLSNRLGRIGNPTGYMNRIIQKLVLTKSSEQREKESKSTVAENDTTDYLNPVDLLVSMEEDNRKELQYAYIQELLSNHRDGLTEQDKEVFTDFYINKKSAKSIASQRNTPMYSVYKMLYRVKRKIRTLTQSLISLEQREEEV